MTDNIENDSPEYECKISMNAFYDQTFCLATRRNPGGANEPVGAVKPRAKSARLLSSMQAKRFFFEEDLGTVFFTTSFPFFQGSCHNSKLTDQKRQQKRGKTGR